MYKVHVSAVHSQRSSATKLLFSRRCLIDVENYDKYTRFLEFLGDKESLDLKM